MNENTLQNAARKFFGAEEIDFSYITEDLIKSDASIGPEAEVPHTVQVLYGNNARYGARVINGETYQVYYFENGGGISDQGNMCGTSYTYWARQDMWHHKYLGKCNTGREGWSFSQ